MKPLVKKIKTGKGRPPWEKTWFEITEVIKKRSVCLYYQVGAVIVRKNQFLSMGYNGPPKGIEHCDEVGCAKTINGRIKKHQGLCRGAHAEINAITNAASLGVNINGADLFVTYRPCAMCTKAILNSSIKRVFYLKDYQGDQIAWEYFSQGKVKIYKIEFTK
ncbi:MAG: cytidine deaminase [Candidatus Moranbacteria bacterium]|nr:cytidine deaminase [Candidatus Moranbacteria bacterium]